MPLAKQAWGDEFGMCVDQFGVDWMVNISSRRPEPNWLATCPPVILEAAVPCATPWPARAA